MGEEMLSLWSPGPWKAITQSCCLKEHKTRPFTGWWISFKIKNLYNNDHLQCAPYKSNFKRNHTTDFFIAIPRKKRKVEPGTIIIRINYRTSNVINLIHFLNTMFLRLLHLIPSHKLVIAHNYVQANQTIQVIMLSIAAQNASPSDWWLIKSKYIWTINHEKYILWNFDSSLRDITAEVQSNQELKMRHKPS